MQRPQVTLPSPSPSQIAELTAELAEERFKGDVACHVLESERAERLRASREVQELKASGRECRGWEWLSRVAGRGGPASLNPDRPVLTSGMHRLTDSHTRSPGGHLSLPKSWPCRCPG